MDEEFTVIAVYPDNGSGSLRVGDKVTFSGFDFTLPTRWQRIKRAISRRAWSVRWRIADAFDALAEWVRYGQDDLDD